MFRFVKDKHGVWLAPALVAATALAPAEALAAAGLPPRGPGFYLSWWKLSGFVAVFLLWVWSTDWINVDCQENRLEHLRWNPIAFGTFLMTFVLLLVLPWFWLGYTLVWLAWICPLTAYIFYRNGRLPAEKRVLTPAHLRLWLSLNLAKIGIHFAAEKEDPLEAGAPVKLMAESGLTALESAARLEATRLSPGFLAVREALAYGLSRRATGIMIDCGAQTAGVRHMIDGVWVEADPPKREMAVSLLQSLRLLCGLKPEQGPKPEDGTFSAEYQARVHKASLVAKPTGTGQQVVIQFEAQKTPFADLDALGMRASMQTQLKELMAQKAGWVFFSAPPATGLRTTMNVMLRAVDRFIREFAAIEAEGQRYEEVENIPVTVYKPDDDLPLALTRLFRTEPNVVVVRDLPAPPALDLLCAQARELVIVSTIRAKDSVDALRRVVALGLPRAELAQSVTAVVNQRLLRRLCTGCKEPYSPGPEILQQMGLPTDKVSKFFRPPTLKPGEKKVPLCPECKGAGYLGRLAVFEVLVVDDSVRKALSTNPTYELLRKAARKAGMRTFQEEGILLVAKGTTSLVELQRMLKHSASTDPQATNAKSP